MQPTCPVASTGAAQETGLKASRKATSHTSVHTGREKVKALILPFVARLTKVQVKTKGETVASIEKKALVDNVSDPLIKMKFWRRSTHSITR